MKFSYEDMKKKFGLRYAINPLNKDGIFEMFDSIAPFPLFNHPNDCMRYYHNYENLRISKRKEEISKEISEIEELPLLKKIISFFSYMERKKLLYFEYQKEMDKHSKNIENLFNWTVKFIDKNKIYNVESPDVNVNDILYIVSVNTHDFGIHEINVFDIKYYCVNDNEFEIKIYAKDNSKKNKEYLILSNKNDILTNLILGNYVFKNKSEAENFIKLEIDNNISFYSKKLNIGS